MTSSAGRRPKPTRSPQPRSSATHPERLPGLAHSEVAAPAGESPLDRLPLLSFLSEELKQLVPELTEDFSCAFGGCPVFLYQLTPHIGVKLFVERLDLRPEPFQFRSELLRRHIVVRPPQGAGIRESQLPRSFVSQFHHSRM